MELDENNRRRTAEDGFRPSAETASTGVPRERVGADSWDALRALRLLKAADLKVTEESFVLMANLLSMLKHDDPVVVRQSIATGTSLFCAVLAEMALQLCQSSMVEGWLEEMWSWMVQFKDAVCGIALEPGSLGAKLLAVKFVEICVLFFTSDVNGNEVASTEGMQRNFNISLLVQGHPILNPALLAFDANKTLGILLDILQLANTRRGSLTVTVINCLAAIGKNRPVYYNCILSALLDFDPDFETSEGSHAASIRYSLRTAFVGFLRSAHPFMIESRDKLLRALRAMYPGEATDQIIRQVEKMARSTDRERNSRDRVSKDDPLSGEISVIADEMPAKRTRFNTDVISSQPSKMVCDIPDGDDAINHIPAKAMLIHGDMTPAGKMIAMIGALLAEGERGAESLEILISNIHPDLLADIVMETMKHLPKNSHALLAGKNGSTPANSETPSSSVSSQIGSAALAKVPGQFLALSSEAASTAAGSSGISMATSDMPLVPNLLADSKRDPRRDPRRLDPRRAASPVGLQSLALTLENTNDMQSGLYHSLSKPSPGSEVIKAENAPEPLMPQNEAELSETSSDPKVDQQSSKESLGDAVKTEPTVETEPMLEDQVSSISVLSPIHAVDRELAASTPSDLTPNEDADGNMMDFDQYSPSVAATPISEDICNDLPVLPHNVDLTDGQKKTMHKLAVTRIIEDYKQIRATGCGQARIPVLARLVAQMNADDDIVDCLQKHIILDYHHHKGHELAINVLYQLHTVMISELDELSSSAANNYEKFLLAVAKSLLDSLPASDKSFSRLLGEAPCLPESAFRLLEDLCHSRGYDHNGNGSFDGDRVTQGLGAAWSLILGRPPDRQACLDIALKCATHSQDEVRTKAIRLVANKLYLLSYASENIEQFARSMLLSVVDQQVSEAEAKTLSSSEQRTEVGSQETSISGSHNSEPGASENESMKGIQASLLSAPSLSLSHAQQQTSLFFALCTKKPSLLQLVFDTYGRAPKAVKQSVHRHVPILLRTLGSTYPELLHIISDPPEGSENLIMLVLQIMTEESTPSADLISAVKHLYETKLKDAAILIPMLSSLSKEEVLPIFPRLVDLPIEKFQAALARVLQGSAHTGPALTPVEVLVAIHDITPERDGVALKKITDACTACFEQRTVFTEQVLAKSLSHLVEQVPIPLLFMRTVIQAIGTFPNLIQFVMGILSKLVSKKIWKMPKLWVGFLKCASQTQPHSFHVLLQLPSMQLEIALNKHSNLRGPLVAYANQLNVRASLSRPTLKVLGLVNEAQQAPRSFISSALHASDASSSVHGATLT